MSKELKPEYYKSNNLGIDVIDITSIFKMNFNLGNVLKYIIRAGAKDSNKHIEDLKKAIVYLEREIRWKEHLNTIEENGYKNIQNKEAYIELTKSGMFYELHPELSGIWEKDKYRILFKP